MPVQLCDPTMYHVHSPPQSTLDKHESRLFLNTSHSFDQATPPFSELPINLDR